MTSSLEHGSNEPPPQKVFIVTAVEDSRLEALQTLYAEAKAKAGAAAQEFDEIKNGIKAELEALQFPAGTEKIVLQGGPGREALVMGWTTQFRFDSKAFKAKNPGTYVQYGKQVGYWTLKTI